MSLVIDNEVVVACQPKTGLEWCDTLEGWMPKGLGTRYPAVVQWEQEPPLGSQWSWPEWNYVTVPQ